ncbi:hypothetical protein E6P09_09585 [Haloferax mediterranei ATCC 33500]|uniref:Uncharacterized protein n=1 Tax=Haloferax mediterranei (strain ATCC 33500 / DSM 1411 / JCM 8866 / NBRC 14739 / NCIMB 2177 / R-4) TaxID=523841 RepID=I3R465_HALMT|nr:hypothetical protein [Haloferax mediterranei]AFK19025.1 hypothetical protein HFX_1314 [Haloferax mediterranei ATCC 33500]AHZ21614.1 hypothetical protein BM92_02610 [Haloferax mediterranei ATCC 33500]EMA03531.1 hypothetical protein C439_03930 [Haloferax mediterranei ATCC 33500]MDX5989120.1 hypothetical protein [Haloferax mediterranei ATCC 33500]QCQ75502.1 hypothetical protein E6P09_09585 [Haloferax mediterranei ATCC 33500]
MSIDCWFQSDAHTCIFGEPGWSGAIGESTLAIFIVAIVVIPIYNKTGDFVLPAVLLALISGMALPLLPGTIASIAWTVLFISVAGSLFILLFRMVIE